MVKGLIFVGWTCVVMLVFRRFPLTLSSCHVNRQEIPSFANEGALWFSDLSMPDPYYLLPVFSSLTFLATIEVRHGDSVAL